MKLFYSILVGLLVLVSCQKKEITLGEHNDNTITIFGEITNQPQQQEVSIIQNPSTYITNGQLTIFNDTYSYYHSYSNNGTYISDSVYELSSNNIYHFKFTDGDSIYQTTFTMPTPIVITDIYTDTITDIYYNNLSVDVASTTSTYFKALVYKGKIDSVSTDTSWVLNQLEPKVYDCTNQSRVEIYTDNESLISDEYQVVKVELKSLTNTSANYLKSLYDYRAHISTTNQYINPPKGCFSNAYGCVFGTCVSTFIKAL